MKHTAFTAFALVACTVAAPVHGAPGDVYVPAHRTANGLWVPANVPTSSGGTRMVPKLRTVKAGRPAAPAETAPAAMSPLFVSADPIRR